MGVGALGRGRGVGLFERHRSHDGVSELRESMVGRNSMVLLVAGTFVNCPAYLSASVATVSRYEAGSGCCMFYPSPYLSGEAFAFYISTA